MRSSGWWLVVSCFLSLAPVTPVPRANGDDFERVRERIESALRDEQIPSLAVAVARHGEVLWEQGFGWADREARLRADEHTLYSLASISKPITATGVMVLQEKGELELDAPVNRYLASSPLVAKIGDVEQATVRKLANHTSGLPLHYQFFYEDDGLRPPPFAQSLHRYGILMSPPGEQFQYANFGYGILDHLITTCSGRPYAEFLREEVFLPLEMFHTAAELTPELKSQAAVRYAPDHTPLPHYDFDHPGASAIYSSAHDLLRFGMFHLQQLDGVGKRVLSKRSIAAMQEPTANVNDERQYGIGWFIQPDDHGLHTVSHSGGMGGVRTRLTLVPEEGIVVVALCNFRSDLPMRMTREILAALLPNYGERMRRAEDHQPNSQPPRPGCPTDLVGYWAGQIATYAGNRRLELWAHPDGDIHARLAGGLRVLLNGSRLHDGILTGVFEGDVGTADANRRPYHLHLRLKMRDGVLNGRATAISLPERKAGNALSYWTELKKESNDPHLLALFNGHDLAGWEVLDRYDFERHGIVRVDEDAVLLGAGRPATGIAWQGAPYRFDYELTVEAKRIAGSDFFCGITFPIGEDYLSLIIGGWGGGVIGISNLDGMSAIENETTTYTEFVQNQWYHVRLRVTLDRVQAWIDDKEIIDVEVSDRKRSIWWEQEPVRPLGFATWNTKAALRNIRLVRIENESSE